MQPPRSTIEITYSFDKLPVELLLRILSSLNVREVIQCLTVNRRWNEVCRTDLAKRQHMSLVVTIPPKTTKWPGTKEEYIPLPPICHTKSYVDWLVGLMPGIKYLHIEQMAEEFQYIVKRLAPTLIELEKPYDYSGLHTYDYKIRPCFPPSVICPYLLKLSLLSTPYPYRIVTDNISYACPILQYLHCRGLKVTDLPLSLRELKCDIDRCRETIGAILRLSNLTNLKLKRIYLYDNLEILRLFGAFDKLTHFKCQMDIFNACYAKMDNAVSELVGRNQELKYVVLYGFMLVGDREMRYFASLYNLQKLIIRSSKITSGGVLSLFRGPHSRNLREVGIDYDSIELTEAERLEIESKDSVRPRVFTFKGWSFHDIDDTIYPSIEMHSN